MIYVKQSLHSYVSTDAAVFFFGFLSTTKMVGLIRLEKYCFPFFSKKVLQKNILVGAPKTYSMIFPLLVSILTPPALLGKTATSLSGRQVKSFLRVGCLFKNYVMASLVAGIATSSYPFSFSFKLSPKPSKFDTKVQFLPFLGPATKYLIILCLLSSEKIMELVDFSQTIPLGKARSLSNTAASPVLRSYEITLPNLCFNKTYLFIKRIEMGDASVRQIFLLSSSIQRLFKFAKVFPSIPLRRQFGVLLLISNLINPFNSVVKYSVLSSLVMMIPYIPLVLLNLKRVSMLPVELIFTNVPSLSPLYIVPLLSTTISSGYFNRSASVMTCACSKYLGWIYCSKLVLRGGRSTYSAVNWEQSMGH